MDLDEPTDEHASRGVGGPSPRDTGGAIDRDLLFGWLAGQVGFLGQDTLLDAVRARSVAPPGTQTIGSILRAWGKLDEGQSAALEMLVVEHLKKHRDDPAAVADHLRCFEATISHGGDRGPAAEDQPTAVLAGSETLPGPADRERGDRRPAERHACRYRKPNRQPHARGGLGEVFLADDLELGRKVALKEIQARNAYDAQSRARFVLEGQVTGNLEHPGIVPVYGLGAYDDGRPYYAMRFIRGMNLKDTVAEFRADGSGRGGPADKALGLRQLLRRFLDVCNAIEYAHSRGVLHRDIKPANIMLGKFGETLVVDWGLAKVMGASAEEPPATGLDPGEGPFHPSSSSGVEPTRRGPLGTFQFMSPEQAAGRLDEIGPRTDVCGLGTTLYFLLTGQSPFPDGDPGRITAGIFPRPREVDPGVPRALEAICLKAMATRPEDRYPSALALADDLDRWLGDQPVAAYPDPLPVRVLRWSRRHRTAVATAASLLVAAVVGLSIHDVVVAGERAKTEKARRVAVDTLVVTGEAIDRMMVEFVVNRLSEIPGTANARMELAERAVRTANEFARHWPNDPVVGVVAAPTHHLTANLRRSLGEFSPAAESYRRAIGFYERAIAAGLPGKGRMEADSLRLEIDYAESLRMDGRRQDALRQLDRTLARIERIRAEDDQAVGPEKALARACYNKGDMLLDHGLPAEALALFERAIPLLEDVMRREKGDPDVKLILTFPLLGRAVAAGAMGKDDEARAAFARALENLEGLGSSSSVRFLRALILDEQGLWLAKVPARLPAAEDAQRRGVDLLAGLVGTHPEYPQYRFALAVARLDRGLTLAGLGDARRAEAAADALAALEALRKLLDEAPRMDQARGRLGEALGLAGALEADRAAATALLDRAVDEQAQAGRDQPGNPRDAAALERHRRALARLNTP